MDSYQLQMQTCILEIGTEDTFLCDLETVSSAVGLCVGCFMHTFLSENQEGSLRLELVLNSSLNLKKYH